MSDCFDHQADAWDDFCFNSDRYVEGDSVYGYNAPYKKGRRSKRNSFCYDPDYYHKKIQFSRIVKETDKSYYIELFKIQDTNDFLYVWIPKKIDGKWRQVAMGQDTQLCDTVKKYEIPNEISPTCYDLNLQSEVENK
jgi:hypothetical protein